MSPWIPPPVHPSRLEPLGRAVLVEPWEPPKKESSLIVLPDSVKERHQTIDVMVKVVKAGPVAWPDEPARAFPGDIVLVAKMSGYMAPGADGKTYRFVNDRDIFAKVLVDDAVESEGGTHD